MNTIAADFERAGGGSVEMAFAASGLLRQRIHDGEAADIFASANMRHPQMLAEAGQGGPVVLFARNRLCALANPETVISTDDFLERLLDPDVRLGTSTPNADPSGDYAWALFEKAEGLRPGSFETLSGKALRLTGGPGTPQAPSNRQTYAWLMTENRADVFLTYHTNAVLAQQDTPELKVVEVPEPLSVHASYGISLLRPDHPEAARFVMFVLSPNGQAILANHGFALPGGP